MKKMIYLLALILGIAAIHMPIHAELLVMKQTKEGFAPLDVYDIDELGMQGLLMTCQWPMDIANESKDVSREEILKAGNARIEERAAEKAIAKYSFFEKDDPDAPSLRVVFFPTCLYELFIIYEAYANKSQNPLQAAIAKVYEPYSGLWGQFSEGKIDILDIIASNNSSQEIRKKINDRYMKIDDEIFMDGTDSAYIYINHELASWLLAAYPDFKQSKDSAALSDAIQNKIEEIKMKLITRLMNIDDPVIAYESRDSAAKKYGKSLMRDLAREPDNQLITKCIALEYEARELNKGLLIRGTSFEKFDQLKSDDNQKMIAGSTVRHEETEYNRETKIRTTKSFEQAYKEKGTTPYSVSFGNSLFAGAIRDRSACAYTFLTGERVYSDSSKSAFKTVGYALLIDKKDYVEHQNSQLFFIPPISPLASLFLRGEFFHARSKAAIAVKPEGRVRVTGVFAGIDKDPTGVILITRDPLKHAALFSQFLADNGRIIQAGDPSKLTPEEKKFADNVLKTQKEAAGYYKGVKGATAFAEKVIPQVRENLKLPANQRKKPQPEQKEAGENKPAESTSNTSSLRALRAKQEQVAREQLEQF
jgi:hypothetical protein